MIRIGRPLTLLFMVVLVAGCAATSDGGPAEGACYLKATHGDVYLRVFDVDRNGNMGALVWQGRINQDQTTRIQTTHAYFRYFYNSEPDVEQPFRSGADKVCDDLATVDVP
ncbi:MAG: hypothetical protein PVF29_12030 [Desulfobacterales bacterium]